MNEFKWVDTRCLYFTYDSLNFPLFSFSNKWQYSCWNLNSIEKKISSKLTFINFFFLIFFFFWITFYFTGKDRLVLPRCCCIFFRLCFISVFFSFSKLANINSCGNSFDHNIAENDIYINLIDFILIMIFVFCFFCFKGKNELEKISPMEL